MEYFNKDIYNIICNYFDLNDDCLIKLYNKVKHKHEYYADNRNLIDYIVLSIHYGYNGIYTEKNSEQHVKDINDSLKKNGWKNIIIENHEDKTLYYLKTDGQNNIINLEDIRKRNYKLIPKN